MSEMNKSHINNNLLSYRSESGEYIKASEYKAAAHSLFAGVSYSLLEECHAHLLHGAKNKWRKTNLDIKLDL